MVCDEYCCHCGFNVIIIISSSLWRATSTMFLHFDDSLADNDNNNLLPTSARVNYQPYGIDFPGGPTGRFCNDRTTVDILGLTYFLSLIFCLSLPLSLYIQFVFSLQLLFVPLYNNSYDPYISQLVLGFTLCGHKCAVCK